MNRWLFSILLSGISFCMPAIGSAFRTWNPRSVCSWVDVESGLNLQFFFKSVHRNQEKVLPEVRIGSRESDAERVRPLGHAANGSYTELEITWEGRQWRVESAQQQSTSHWLTVRFIPIQSSKLPLRIGAALHYIWNKPGETKKQSPYLLAGKWKGGWAQPIVPDFSIPALEPSWLSDCTDTLHFWLSDSQFQPSKSEMNALLAKNREAYYRPFRLDTDTSLARFAVQSAMAWNTIFDPAKQRVLHTVNRMWSVNRGGYVIFCWDNFFGSLLSWYGLRDTALAFSNFKAVLEDATPEGFPSNNSQGNGRKAFDRSQPPVGSLVALQLFRKTGSTSFVRQVWPALFKWNRWWLKQRLNGELLSWGSHPAANPFDDPACHTLLGAKLESGMDDSPMFDSTQLVGSLMNLHDVGLNALFIADCQALLALAQEAGLRVPPELARLKRDVKELKKAFSGLYHTPSGLYLNRYLPSGSFSKLLSPTHAYPLLISGLSPKHRAAIWDSLILHPQRLGGPFLLPSIARNHPDFEQQRYWRGSIWPPLNYLVFQGLLHQREWQKAKVLADNSFQLFIAEYKRAQIVCENYSGRNGRCDDPNIKAEPYYFWGGLLALMSSELAEATKAGQ